MKMKRRKRNSKIKIIFKKKQNYKINRKCKTKIKLKKQINKIQYK